MREVMKASLKMTKRRELECLCGRMGGNIMGIGKAESRMAWGCIFRLMARGSMANGGRGKGNNGLQRRSLGRLRAS